MILKTEKLFSDQNKIQKSKEFYEKSEKMINEMEKTIKTEKGKKKYFK